MDQGKKDRIADFPIGKAEEFLDYLFVCCRKENAVHIKAHIQDLGSDSLVSFDERMIHDQSKKSLAILLMAVG